MPFSFTQLKTEVGWCHHWRKMWVWSHFHLKGKKYLTFPQYFPNTQLPDGCFNGRSFNPLSRTECWTVTDDDILKITRASILLTYIPRIELLQMSMCEVRTKKAYLFGTFMHLLEVMYDYGGISERSPGEKSGNYIEHMLSVKMCPRKKWKNICCLWVVRKDISGHLWSVSWIIHRTIPRTRQLLPKKYIRRQVLVLHKISFKMSNFLGFNPSRKFRTKRNICLMPSCWYYRRCLRPKCITFASNILTILRKHLQQNIASVSF